MDWYRVECDDEGFSLAVNPPGQEGWTARIRWDAVERICYEVGEFLTSDTYYVFVKGRENSYPVATEAVGGADLAGKFAKHGLFPVETLLEAMAAGEGAITCFPGVEPAS